jgi:hypothetical protein
MQEPTAKPTAPVMLWKILEAKITASDPSPKFVRHFIGTEAEAQALINPAPRLQANLLPYDEVRNYYAERKLDAYAQEEGRIRAICSQTTDADLRPYILNVVEETRAEIERIRAAESNIIIANLSHLPRGLVLLSEKRPK